MDALFGVTFRIACANTYTTRTTTSSLRVRIVLANFITAVSVSLAVNFGTHDVSHHERYSIVVRYSTTGEDAC